MQITNIQLENLKSALLAVKKAQHDIKCSWENPSESEPEDSITEDYFNNFSGKEFNQMEYELDMLEKAVDKLATAVEELV